MVTPEEIGRIAVFECLDTADRERVCRAAADINLSAEEFAAHEGDERALFAVLEGQIEATRMVDGIHRQVGIRNPGDLFGEVPVTLGTVRAGPRPSPHQVLVPLRPRDRVWDRPIAPEPPTQARRHRAAARS